jgi:hypothetical protein
MEKYLVKCFFLFALVLALACVDAPAQDDRQATSKANGEKPPQRTSAERFRRAESQVRDRKYQVDSVLHESTRAKLNLSPQQQTRLGLVVRAMDESFAKALKAIEAEAFESDAEGPAYAIHKLPDLDFIIEQCRAEIRHEVLSKDQAKLLQDEWKEMNDEALTQTIVKMLPIESLWYVGKNPKASSLGTQIHIEDGKAVIALRDIPDSTRNPDRKTTKTQSLWNGESLRWGGRAQIFYYLWRGPYAKPDAEKRVFFSVESPVTAPRLTLSDNARTGNQWTIVPVPSELARNSAAADNEVWGYIRVADVQNRELWLGVADRPILLNADGKLVECLELAIGEKKEHVFRYVRTPPQSQ